MVTKKMEATGSQIRIAILTASIKKLTTNNISLNVKKKKKILYGNFQFFFNVVIAYFIFNDYI